MIYNWKYKTPKEYSNIIMNSDGESLIGLFFEDSKDSSKHEVNCVNRDGVFWQPYYSKIFVEIYHYWAFFIFFSHIFLIYFNDNVDSVKPITGTNELNSILE